MIATPDAEGLALVRGWSRRRTVVSLTFVAGLHLPP